MIKIYYATYHGRRISKSPETDRRVMQMFVNRNNAAAARRGDESKPYGIEAVEQEN